MNLIPLLLLPSVVLASVPRTLPTATPASLPFWRTNPVVFKKITDERACIVAAHRDDLSDGSFLYVAHGGDLISAPREDSFRITQDYSHLKDISDYFKEVDWHPDTNILHIVIEALGYHGALDVHIVPKSDGAKDELDFDIPTGDFKGLSGLYALEDYGFGKTLSSIEIDFKTVKPPLPKVFMSMALEIVTQKVGERLRTYIEDEPKRPKGKQK